MGIDSVLRSHGELLISPVWRRAFPTHWREPCLGDGVLLRWRDVELQLPRTNNAGAPSYTDGRWWWRVVDESAPEFWERRGTVIRHHCELI